MFFRAYLGLGWSLKHVAQNDRFIAISFYRNIVCQNVLCEEGLKKIKEFIPFKQTRFLMLEIMRQYNEKKI